MRVFPPWGPWDRISFFVCFFFQWFWHIFKYLILIITSLAIHSGVFYGFYFSLLASRLPPFDRKTLKNCTCSADPGLLNETKGFLFLVFLHIKTDGKNKLLSLYVPIYRNVHFLVLLLKLHLTKLTKAWTQNTKNRWIEK